MLYSLYLRYIMWKIFSKSKQVLFVTVLVCIITLCGCENFLQGATTKKQLDDLVAYLNAPKATIKVSLGSADFGIVYPPNFTGTEGESFTIEFTKKENVVFKCWTCFDSNGNSSEDVTFSEESVRYDPANGSNIYTVKATINNIKEGIEVRPKCYLSNERIPPVLVHVSAFSTSDTSSEKYKELTDKDFGSWDTNNNTYTHGDYGNNLLSHSIYFKLTGYDEQSGLSDIKITETYYNNVSGSTVNSVYEPLFIPVDKCKKFNDIYSFDYDFKTVFDGIIKLEISLMDYAENESIESEKKVFYVLKDTSIDESKIYFEELDRYQTYDSYVQWTETTNMPLPFPKRETINGRDTITLTLNNTVNFKDQIYSGWKTEYDMKIFWGYSLNEITNLITPEKNSDGNNVYRFTRNAKQVAFIKIICKDYIGNEKQLIRAFPPELDFDKESAFFVQEQQGSQTNMTIHPYNISNYQHLCQTVGAMSCEIQYIEYPSVTEYRIYVNGNLQLVQDAYYMDSSITFTNSYAGKTPLYYMVMCFRYEDGSFYYSPVSTTALKVKFNSSYTGTTSGYTTEIIGKPSTTAGNNTYIKNNISLSVEPVKNSGLYKLTVSDYKTQAGLESEVNYKFKCVVANTSESYIFAEDVFYLPSSNQYRIYIISEDTSGKKYTSSYLNFYLNGSTSSSTTLTLSEDLTPPVMSGLGINQSYRGYFEWYHSTPSSFTPHWHTGTLPSNPPYSMNPVPNLNAYVPVDDKQMFSTTVNSKTVGKIEYYFIPNPQETVYDFHSYSEEEISQYPKRTAYYDLNQMDYLLPQFSGRSGTNNSYSSKPIDESGILNTFHQMRIELPYDGLEEGFYTVCLKAYDANNNYTWAFAPAVNQTTGTFLSWTFDSSKNTITNNGGKRDRLFVYYYDNDHDRWVAFYNDLDSTTNEGYRYHLLSTSQNEKIYENNFLKNRWAKFIGYKYVSEVGGGPKVSNSKFYNVQYVYLDYERYKNTNNAIVCNVKDIFEGGVNGIQVFADAPVFVHTLYCSRCLTDTNTPEDAIIWENKATETGVAFKNGSFTYGYENLEEVPNNVYYTTIAHFADGSVVMGEIKTK